MKQATESTIWTILRHLIACPTSAAVSPQAIPLELLQGTYSSGGLGKVYRNNPQVFSDAAAVSATQANTVATVLAAAQATGTNEKRAICYALAARHGDSEALVNLYRILIQENCSDGLVSGVRRLIKRRYFDLVFQIIREHNRITFGAAAASALSGMINQAKARVMHELLQLNQTRDLASTVERLQATRRYAAIFYISASNSDSSSPQRLLRQHDNDRQGANARVFFPVSKRVIHWDSDNFADLLQVESDRVRGPLQLVIMGHGCMNGGSITARSDGTNPISNETLCRALRHGLMNFRYPVEIKLDACSGGAGERSMAGYLAENLGRQDIFVHATLSDSCTLADGTIATCPMHVATDADRTRIECNKLFDTRTSDGYLLCHDYRSLLDLVSDHNTREAAVSAAVTKFQEDHQEKFPPENMMLLIGNLLKLYRLRSFSTAGYVPRQAGSRVTLYYENDELRSCDTYAKLFGEEVRSIPEGDQSIRKDLSTRIYELHGQSEVAEANIEREANALLILLEQEQGGSVTAAASSSSVGSLLPQIQLARRFSLALAEQRRPGATFCTC